MGNRRANILTVGSLGISALNVFITVYMPMYLIFNNFNGLAVSAVASANFLIGTVVQPFSGMLSDILKKRTGSRKLLIIIFISITGICIKVIPGLRSNFILCIVSLLLFISYHMYQVPLSAMVPDNMEREDRGMASGLWGFYSMAGSLFTPLIAALLWNYNQRLLFDTMGVITVATAGIPFIFIKEKPALPEGRNYLKLKDILHTSKGKRIANFYIIKSSWWMAAGLIVPFFPRFMTEVFRIEIVSISITVEAALLLGSALAIYISRHGESINKKILLKGTMIYIALYSVVYMKSDSLYMVIAAMVLYGAVISILTVVPLSILYNILPEGYEGSFMGIDNVFLNLPQSLSIGGAGIIWAVSGIRSIYIISIIFSAVTIILLMDKLE